MGIVAIRTLSASYRFMLISTQKKGPAVTSIAEIRLVRLERQSRPVRYVRMRPYVHMAGVAAAFHRCMHDPALAHGLVALVAVLVLCGMGKSAAHADDRQEYCCNIKTAFHIVHTLLPHIYATTDPG